MILIDTIFKLSAEISCQLYSIIQDQSIQQIKTKQPIISIHMIDNSAANIVWNERYNSSEQQQSEQSEYPQRNFQDQIQVPHQYRCPITLQIMQDPVLASDYHTYQRKAIQLWLKRSKISPKTGQKLSDAVIKPNIALRTLINDFMRKKPSLIRRRKQQQQLQKEIIKKQKKLEKKNQKIKVLGDRLNQKHRENFILEQENKIIRGLSGQQIDLSNGLTEKKNEFKLHFQELKNLYKGNYLQKLYALFQSDQCVFGQIFNSIGTYYGQISRGRRQGYGRLQTRKGQVFQGNWQNGFLNGYGCYIGFGQKSYQGNWILGQRNGFGQQNSFLKRASYQGYWQKDKKHGAGILIIELNGEKIIQQQNWNHGKRVKPSKMENHNFWKRIIYEQKQHFANQFHKKNLKKNQISLTIKNGSYSGQARNGKPHGRGKAFFKNGNQYQGEWKNGNLHGYGVFRFKKTSDVYQGYFKNGRQEKFGIYKWNNYPYKQDFYQGQWKQGVSAGFGIQYYRNLEQTYQGNWKSDLWQGQGKYYFKNGDVFQGLFHQGIKIKGIKAILGGKIQIFPPII